MTSKSSKVVMKNILLILPLISYNFVRKALKILSERAEKIPEININGIFIDWDFFFRTKIISFSISSKCSLFKYFSNSLKK